MLGERTSGKGKEKKEKRKSQAKAERERESMWLDNRENVTVVSSKF